MTGMKCEWGRPPAVSAANMNGGRLSMQIVPKKNCKVNGGEPLEYLKNALIWSYALWYCVKKQ